MCGVAGIRRIDQLLSSHPYLYVAADDGRSGAELWQAHISLGAIQGYFGGRTDLAFQLCAFVATLGLYILPGPVFARAGLRV